MRHLTGADKSQMVHAIDEGSATKVEEACFSDGCEADYRIDFYHISGRIVRCEHSDQSTDVRLDLVTGEELDLFKQVYHLD